MYTLWFLSDNMESKNFVLDFKSVDEILWNYAIE